VRSRPRPLKPPLKKPIITEDVIGATIIAIVEPTGVRTGIIITGAIIGITNTVISIRLTMATRTAITAPIGGLPIIGERASRKNFNAAVEKPARGRVLDLDGNISHLRDAACKLYSEVTACFAKQTQPPQGEEGTWLLYLQS
jgi:hypothetical protein